MAKIDFKENGSKGLESNKDGAQKAHKHEVSMTDLPFICHDKAIDSINAWSVPKDKDYFAACTTGVFYAREFLKYLRDSYDDPSYNTLIQIVGDMDHREHAQGRGFQVGFLNTLEELLTQLAKTTDFETKLNEMIAKSVQGGNEAENE
ncbi:hypothetical protein ICN32_00840 [Polynucleobacter wuianus]|uniref:hypothetical protein n=1 Tax=Polynucleobacter wuianus TaxID=1743168 RepID=UPI001C0E4905|nr:hypothetical protein [Polynucleobacter wuianus]MBU3609104.1 hypothetical protein [Polynucleobacter wuianus]